MHMPAGSQQHVNSILKHSDSVTWHLAPVHVNCYIICHCKYHLLEPVLIVMSSNCQQLSYGILCTTIYPCTEVTKETDAYILASISEHNFCDSSDYARFNSLWFCFIFFYSHTLLITPFSYCIFLFPSLLVELEKIVTSAQSTSCGIQCLSVFNLFIDKRTFYQTF